jgi:hypothetical protein
MDTVNHSIQCSVTNCAHHDATEDYCTLNEIKVGCACDTRVTNCKETECASFHMDAAN